MRRTLTLSLTIFIALNFYCEAEIIAKNTRSINKISPRTYTVLDSMPKPTGWVNDYEKLFTPKQEVSFTTIIKNFKKQTGIEITIVTLDSTYTSKEEFDEFTLQMFNTWGVGEKDKNNGILIGISRMHRKMRIQNGYGIEKLISDAETKNIIDKYFIPGYKKGDYYKGTLSGLTNLIKLLKTKVK
ncbi:MAG: TPM domain-containing protein [Daejeonella sp.]